MPPTNRVYVVMISAPPTVKWEGPIDLSTPLILLTPTCSRHLTVPLLDPLFRDGTVRRESNQTQEALSCKRFWGRGRGMKRNHLLYSFQTTNFGISGRATWY